MFSACYTYTAVDLPAPGSEVRVLLPVTSALDNPNAAPPTVAIEGLVLSSGNTLVLATQTRSEISQFRQFVQFDTLHLARDAYTGLQTKEFSTAKSIVLGGVIFGGIALATTFVFTGGSKNDVPRPGPGGPAPALVIDDSILSNIWGLLTLR